MNWPRFLINFGCFILSVGAVLYSANQLSLAGNQIISILFWAFMMILITGHMNKSIQEGIESVSEK